ncbi:MAG: biotin-independent malonate decarboxylase subunit gamma [Lautropia sp.]|nr:biotin-independent malonate decarboxylase subunit gamma [Lautropia sp.]
MTNDTQRSRGETWLHALTGNAGAVDGLPQSVRVVDGMLDDMPARFIAVVPDPENPFPRARSGETGLLEGWGIARAVRQVVREDKGTPHPRAIVAIVDVPSQAYGRREEAWGIHQALASAVSAYAEARAAGHSVIALIVGKAMSGGFLAHGYQANRLIALDDAGVMVHAMGKHAAARVTLRTVEQLEKLAASVPPMAYDIGSFDRLGLLWRLLKVSSADTPRPDDVDAVKQCLRDALADIPGDERRDLSTRLDRPLRKCSIEVRERLKQQWAAPPS